MIPTVILIGLLLGLLVRDDRSLVSSVAGAGFVALVWAVLVGVSDSSFGTAIGGGALAVVNAGVGGAVGVAIRFGLGGRKPRTRL